MITTKYFRLTFRIFIFLILLFILIYIEPLSVGPLKISQIWKSIVVLILFSILIKKKLPIYVWVGLLFALKFLFYIYFPSNILSVFHDFLNGLIFPLWLGFIFVQFKKVNNRNDILVNTTIALALFFIYSTLPFILGLSSLNPINPREEFLVYGGEGRAIKGLFYGIAPASKMFVISTIVILNTYKKFSKSLITRIIWVVTIIYGSYLVFMSWTRTGWLIFAIALVLSLYYKSKLKNKVIALIFSLLIIITIYNIFISNQAFRSRLVGKINNEVNISTIVENISMARLSLISVAIDNIKDEGTLGFIFGYGRQHGIELFDKKTGMAISSHNRTFEILESNGIIGLLLYLIFISILLYNIVIRYKFCSKDYQKLTFVLTFIFIGFFLISHGTPIWGEIIIGNSLMIVVLQELPETEKS